MRYRISTSALHALREYEFHPESKSADASGAPCRKQTVGLLGRRHILIDGLIFIGKESNKPMKWLPILKAMPIPELIERSGLSERALYMIRAGRRPQPENASRLKSIAKERGK